MKRNLVVVRAGPSSLHPNWLLPAEEGTGIWSSTTLVMTLISFVNRE